METKTLEDNDPEIPEKIRKLDDDIILKKKVVVAKPNKCVFKVVRKGRNCNQIIKKDAKYCVEHSYMDENSPEKRKRVICPLDNKHSCFEDSLFRHLKRCNARVDDSQPGYQLNINAGDLSVPCDKVTLRQADTEEVTLLIEKIKTIYDKENLGEIRTDIRLLERLKCNKEEGSSSVSIRHYKQQSSLIAHMEEQGFLEDNMCYVEFGAGKGGLSHYVQRSTDSNENVKFVLIDRGSNRYKKDGLHRMQGPAFERVKMDIANLNLCELDNFKDCQKPIVAIGKHLCGMATDLMIRCLVNTTSSESTKLPVAGIVLALCCHHECDWPAYVGQSTMQQYGINGRQFHIMRCLSSWAVCGCPDKDHTVTDTVVDKMNRFSHISSNERTKIGHMCKYIINRGRVNYLKQNGYQTETLIYVDKEHSLENVALVAKKINNQ